MKEPEQWIKDWGSRLAGDLRDTPVCPQDYEGWILKGAITDMKQHLFAHYTSAFAWLTGKGIEISVGDDDEIFGTVELKTLNGHDLLEVFQDRLHDEPEEAHKVLAWFEAVTADMKALIEEEEI